MKVNNDFREKIKTIGLFGVQFYKIIMGTMLTIFVPQKCAHITIDNNSTDLTISDSISKLCSFDENIESMDNLTFGFNSWTAFMFILLYTVEIKREYWLIKVFDIDHDKPDNNLEIIFADANAGTVVSEDKLTIIKNRLTKYNDIYLGISLITTVFFVINNLVAMNILYDRNYGSASLNTFISFVMLIMIKLYHSNMIAYQSRKDHKALSSFMTEFSSFNVIDEDIVDDSVQLNRP